MSNLHNYNHYVSEFESFGKNGASEYPEWVNTLRRSALAVFAEKGFPTTHDENWKYTNIAPIAKTSFKYASDKLALDDPGHQVGSFMIEGLEHHSIVFINGKFSKEYSSIDELPAGVIVTTMREAVRANAELVKKYISQYVPLENNAFAALNTAFLNDGVFVYVPEDVEIDKPIHCLFITSKAGTEHYAVHIRNLIIVEERSKVRFAFSYRSSDENQNLTNVVTEIVAKEGSDVEAVKIQKESDSTYHVENFRLHQFAKSTVNVFSLALGSAIARNDMSVIIDGEGADCNLNGLYFTAGDQLIDHHTFMHHIHPNCPSHELFKGILYGNSRAVFNGKVYVEPEAQKTDSKQTNRNLLLSDTAVVDTKPELEIFADDVKCTHGAAVGGLDPVHAFYLKSRGISAENAEKMLTVGFAAEVTGKIVTPEIRRYVDVLVVDRLREKLGSLGLPDIVHN
ncbi:MAG: Fe-S cluster assembly protein SufD [Bacteroidota bacterium]